MLSQSRACGDSRRCGRRLRSRRIDGWYQRASLSELLLRSSLCSSRNRRAEPLLDRIRAAKWQGIAVHDRQKEAFEIKPWRTDLKLSVLIDIDCRLYGPAKKESSSAFWIRTPKRASLRTAVFEQSSKRDFLCLPDGWPQAAFQDHVFSRRAALADRMILQCLAGRSQETPPEV